MDYQEQLMNKQDDMAYCKDSGPVPCCRDIIQVYLSIILWGRCL